MSNVIDAIYSNPADSDKGQFMDLLKTLAYTKGCELSELQDLAGDYLYVVHPHNTNPTAADITWFLENL